MSDREQAHGAERGGGASPQQNPATRGSFLGFVAHELRNPLSTALWSAELLARLAPDDRAGARGEKLSNMCLRALQRLRLLVEDHFLAERLDVAGIPFKIEPIRLRELVEQLAGKAGVSATLAVDERLAVDADRGVLERALDAVLAAAGQGKTPVLVEASISGPRVTIRVRGAPPPAGVLDPPHKGSPSDPTGRALSLYMATKVASALDGALVASEDAYLLTIPLADAAPGTP